MVSKTLGYIAEGLGGLVNKMNETDMDLMTYEMVKDFAYNYATNKGIFPEDTRKE